MTSFPILSIPDLKPIHAACGATIEGEEGREDQEERPVVSDLVL
jgi:hypothetical protein